MGDVTCRTGVYFTPRLKEAGPVNAFCRLGEVIIVIDGVDMCHQIMGQSNASPMEGANPCTIMNTGHMFGEMLGADLPEDHEFFGWDVPSSLPFHQIHGRLRTQHNGSWHRYYGDDAEFVVNHNVSVKGAKFLMGDPKTNYETCIPYVKDASALM